MANRVKMLRLSHRHTEKQLADKLEISVSTLQRYQRGGDIPSSILQKMSALFGVSIDEILLEEENREEKEDA